MPAEAGILVYLPLGRRRMSRETRTSDIHIEVIHAPGMDKGLLGAIPTSICMSLLRWGDENGVQLSR
jgi:hypothetical protein